MRKPLPTAEEIAALPPDGGPGYNRLIFEQSPYLLQHAGNPVDWYPWGDEAFERARKEDKPIFMSIGYSTCHWCHVMEHESFEDEQVAALLNANFIPIKVDREERPDLDAVYMSVTQAMTGRGGWPMTIVMTPDAQPFFAGTYFPKSGRGGMRGMLDLLPAISDTWRNDRARLLADADRAVSFVQSSQRSQAGDAPDAKTLDLCFEHLARRFDPVHGGFGQEPKFPVPHQLVFLLTYYQRTGEARALEMVETTLDAMARGGIYDHVGFGFARYSTDRAWLVPHFEKMLYDQALLAMANIAAWQITGKAQYRRTTEEIFTYLQRDMTSPEGGFYSAEDADSEGEEGLFYLWSLAQLRDVLGTDAAEQYAAVYGATKRGNFNEGGSTGRNILNLPRSVAQAAAKLGVELDQLESELEVSRQKLFEEREQRIHPFKDDKVLTDWNGLMIAALAQAARAFDEPRYEAQARRAADFAMSTLTGENGRLFKRWRAGEAGLPGTLEDYAFLGFGLIELYQTNFEERYLREAVRLTDVMIQHFADADAGGFFLTADDGLELFIRPKEIYDGAIPSGNSVAAYNLIRLARLTGNTDYEVRATETMAAFGGQVGGSPSGHTQLMAAVDFAAGPSYEVVIVGDPQADDTKAMIRSMQRPFLPGKVVVLRPAGDAPPITKLAEYTLEQRGIDGKATAYVCRDFACGLPTTDIEKALAMLKPERSKPE